MEMEMNMELEELELNDAQAERVDEVLNAVYELCRVLTENEDLEWNMGYIGEIADLAASILTEQGHKVRYPAVVTEADDSQHIEEYYSD